MKQPYFYGKHKWLLELRTKALQLLTAEYFRKLCTNFISTCAYLDQLEKIIWKDSWRRILIVEYSRISKHFFEYSFASILEP